MVLFAEQQRLSSTTLTTVVIARKKASTQLSIEHRRDRYAATAHDNDHPTYHEDGATDCCPTDEFAGQGTNTDPSFLTMFGTFLRAAFSDGYHNTTCCSAGELFLTEGRYYGIESNVRSQTPERRTLSTQLSYVSSSLSSSKLARSSISSKKQTSNNSGNITRNTGSSSNKKRKKKRALALAVGCNYAEDMNGRPIVITPARATIGSLNRARSRDSRQVSAITQHDDEMASRAPSASTGQSPCIEPRET